MNRADGTPSSVSTPPTRKRSRVTLDNLREDSFREVPGFPEPADPEKTFVLGTPNTFQGIESERFVALRRRIRCRSS